MNYRINKRRKNYSKKKKTTQEIFLPSLNNKLPINKMPNSDINISNSVRKPQNNIQKGINIKDQIIRKQEKKFTKPMFLQKNHKPYSGNPSIKVNNNEIEIKAPIKKNFQNSYERDILTANPSLVGNKASFIKYNNEIYSNLRYDDKGIIINNEVNYKENIRDIQKNPEKNRKIHRKIGFGISKSSPRISSIKIISNPFENQKQKEIGTDFLSKINVLLSSGDYINNKSNNMLKIKRYSNLYPDSKNLIEQNNNSLIKEKNGSINLPNLIGANLIQNSEAKNMLIKAVGKLNFQLIKKHPNLKSANLKNQLSDNYLNKKISKHLLKNLSKSSLNSSLIETKNNNNSSLKLNEENKKTIKPKSKCFISYAYIDYPNLEHRKEMEDFHCIKQALGKRYNLSYFAIFDGHGGKEVASFLSINLHHYLINELNNIQFGINDEENINNIIECIKLAFIKIDKDILANDNLANDVGSTATLIFIYYNNLNAIENYNNENQNLERTLICANIGDSSGYLINKSNIKLITKHHKCEDASEVKRIRDQGGIVFQGRIFGKLILTRTLGDKEMKKYGVIPEPDFYIKKIEKDDFFVIIASDGIWDVINEDELFKIGNEKKLSSEAFSKKIMDIAKERDTRDNSSCIVIKVNKNI
jgi:serine/threonine protein phosphatase PrpC